MKKTTRTLLLAAAFLALILISANIRHTIRTNVSDDPYQAGIAKKIIRLHIIANSDSEADQSAKRKVRNAVGTLMQQKMEQERVTTLDESRELIERSLSEIRDTAKQELENCGISEPSISVSLSTSLFPEKNYGSYVFPAGRYESVKIVIGAGEGHNWWCVLYPNLCFHDCIRHSDENTQTLLKEVLSTQEYEHIIEKKQYRIRFRILDFVKQTFGI